MPTSGWCGGAERSRNPGGECTCRWFEDGGARADSRCRPSGTLVEWTGHGPVAQRERASLAWKRSGVRFPEMEVGVGLKKYGPLRPIERHDPVPSSMDPQADRLSVWGCLAGNIQSR